MKKKAKVLLISYAGALVFVLSGLIFTQAAGEAGFRTSQDNEYRRAMAQLVSSVSSADEALQQGQFASGAGMSGKVCARLMSAAESAGTALSILPMETYTWEEVAEFLSQLHEYAQVKGDLACQGTGFSQEDREMFGHLQDITADALPVLSEMYRNLAEGNLSIRGWQTQRGLVTTAEDSYLEDELLTLLGDFPGVPELSYAGKLSSDYDDGYQALAGLEEVSEAQARTVAQGLLSEDHAVELMTESQGSLPSYYYTIPDAQVPVTIAVTKQGGKPLMYLAEYAPGEGSLEEGRLRLAARDFLQKAGYEGLQEAGSREAFGQLEIDYVHTDGEAEFLADAVTVAVAKDTGEVLSMNAENYLHHHTDRSQQPKLSADEAKALAVPENLRVLEEKLTWFTDEAGQTKLSWAFYSQRDETSYCTIFADVETGRQLEIRMEQSDRE